MLFNTLAYAQFLALVFVVSWALVERRFALLLPWLPLGAFALAHPSWLSVGVAAGGLVVGLGAAWRAPAELRAPWALGVTLLEGAALGGLSWRELGLEPGSYLLGLLGVPTASLPRGLTTLALLAVGVWLVRARKVRLLFLLGASYAFYAHWDYRFLPLIWASSTADYWLARAIAQSKTERGRKIWLVFTVVMNLGVLGFFKYFNFGVDTAVSLLAAAGVEVEPVALRIALPVGISFFTFESMSYVIDVYRRELEPHRSYSEYLTFVAFFPHLVAGPIVRPRDLLPQLAEKPRFSPREASEGLFLIAMGLGKKIVVGDYLALNLVDRVFDAPLMYSALEVYAATVGYALQIYCDFSGYTDIAIGSALLLGVRFPLNFRSPYKAVDVVDFWRRWHISLSTWLRDYLYIPLGGNRRGRGRTYLNLFVTMVLGGLWHGASFTFVVWGALHGAALAVNRFWKERWGAPKDAEVPAGRRVLGVVVTFHFVCATWIFFRAESFAQARLVFAQLATGTLHHPNLPLSVVGVLALGLGLHYVPERLFASLRDRFTGAPAWAQGLLLFLVALLLRRMASADAVPFVYFQF